MSCCSCFRIILIVYYVNNFGRRGVGQIGETKFTQSALDIKVKRLIQIFSGQEKETTRVEDFHVSLFNYSLKRLQPRLIRTCPIHVTA